MSVFELENDTRPVRRRGWGMVQYRYTTASGSCPLPANTLRPPPLYRNWRRAGASQKFPNAVLTLATAASCAGSTSFVIMRRPSASTSKRTWRNRGLLYAACTSEAESLNTTKSTSLSSGAPLLHSWNARTPRCSIARNLVASAGAGCAAIDWTRQRCSSHAMSSACDWLGSMPAPAPTPSPAPAATERCVAGVAIDDGGGKDIVEEASIAFLRRWHSSRLNATSSTITSNWHLVELNATVATGVPRSSSKE